MLLNFENDINSIYGYVIVEDSLLHVWKHGIIEFYGVDDVTPLYGNDSVYWERTLTAIEYGYDLDSVMNYIHYQKNNIGVLAL